MKIEDLRQPYSQDLFFEINNSLIGVEFKSSQLSIHPDNSKFITNAKYYGSYEDLDLHIFVVEHTSTEDARVGVSLEIFKLMKKYALQNALVAAYSKNSDSWRYSLVTSNLSINDKGKVTKEFSSPRRFSFVLGPNQKVLTPYKQLIQSANVTDIAELSKRFSLEVVNNEFYKEIAKLYDKLVGTEKTTRELKYPSNGNESHEFAVRLIGRIIFCWFLREKKSKAGIALVPSRVLSREASNQPGYYHNVLAPLFFEVLNKPLQRRTNKFQVEDYKDVPYLNGGLFSNDSIDHYKFDKSLELSIPGLVDIPDSWFHELFDLLERFNFTVDENTSYDTDLSIDPEMLGRVFENLLARINPETGETVRKSTGSFYTPREIVEYMVDSSLSEHLYSKTKIAKPKIEALVSYDLFDDIGNELSQEEKLLILEALSTLTVLDPACGSGAFPIGMLQKIVFIISIIDPKAEWWLARQLKGASPELRREFSNRSIDYIRKLGIIRQTIFGVDIQSIATEISRLRCFLTLIVDEAVDDTQENRGIRPLPNLEFKFVTANTLLPLPEQRFASGHVQQDIFDNSQQEKIDKLKYLIDEFFSATTSEKSEIKAEYRYVQNQLWSEMHKSSAYGQQSLALTGWDPFEHQPCNWFDPIWMYGVEHGFDIVIGNPPYVQLQKNGGELADLYKNMGYETFTRSGDIYTIFFEQGINLLSESGYLCFITSNKWMRTSYGAKLREYFTKFNPLKLIDFAGLQVFDTAAVDTSIIVIQKAPNSNLLNAVHFKDDYQKEGEIKEYFASNHNTLRDLSKETWFIGDQTEINLKEKIEKLGTPLKNWPDLAINYGIKTGANDVFIVDENFKAELELTEPESASALKPLLRGSHARKYMVDWSNDYILYIPWHYPITDSSVKGVSQKAEKAFASEHPYLYSYFQSNKERLCERNKAETGIRYEWYALQRSGSSYREDFDKPKVVWMNMNRGWKFAYSEPGYYVDMTLNFMASEKYAKLMTGILSSKVHKWYFIQTGRIFDNGGYMTKVDSVNNFPVPLVNSRNESIITQIEDLTNSIIANGINDPDTNKHNQNEIDRLVYQIYELTPEEIAIVEDAISI